MVEMDSVLIAHQTTKVAVSVSSASFLQHYTNLKSIHNLIKVIILCPVPKAVRTVPLHLLSSGLTAMISSKNRNKAIRVNANIYLSTFLHI